MKPTRNRWWWYFTAHHPWVINRQCEQWIASLPKGSRILDAGAGECGLRKVAKYYGHEYTGVDLAVGDKRCDYGLLDHVCDLASMPMLKTAYFDAVIFCGAIEHVRDLDGTMTELNRVLRPDGKMWLRTPLAQGEHQVPHDYRRFTRYGLADLAQRYGFRVLWTKPSGGVFWLLGSILIRLPFICLGEQSRWVDLAIRIAWLPAILVSNALASSLDWLDRRKQWTKDFTAEWQKH